MIDAARAWAGLPPLAETPEVEIRSRAVNRSAPPARGIACRIARGILDAALEGSSVKYTDEQVAEFERHCLSKSGYYNPLRGWPRAVGDAPKPARLPPLALA